VGLHREEDQDEFVLGSPAGRSVQAWKWVVTIALSPESTCALVQSAACWKTSDSEKTLNVTVGAMLLVRWGRGSASSVWAVRKSMRVSWTVSSPSARSAVVTGSRDGTISVAG
jgi:hypothetical protein